jgi:hypothetical protein
MAKRKNPHAVALGRRGGRVVTPKKIAHLRRIAKSGGRKPKFETGVAVTIGEGAPLDIRGLPATIVKRLDRARYRVELADGEEHDLYSWWLDLGKLPPSPRRSKNV